MSLGGKQTTSVSIPSWLQEPVQRSIQRGEDIAKIGYVPYSGPDVAAFTPAQQAAFDNTNAAAAAFGMQGGQGNLPAPTNFGGVQGYSSFPIYQAAVNDFAARSPGQYQAMSNLFVNPQTGAVPGLTLTSMPGQPGFGGDQRGDGTNAMADPFSGYGNTPGPMNFGGYSGAWDMVNGGGPGAGRSLGSIFGGLF